MGPCPSSRSERAPGGPALPGAGPHTRNEPGGTEGPSFGGGGVRNPLTLEHPETRLGRARRGPQGGVCRALGSADPTGAPKPRKRRGPRTPGPRPQPTGPRTRPVAPVGAQETGDPSAGPGPAGGPDQSWAVGAPVDNCGETEGPSLEREGWRGAPKVGTPRLTPASRHPRGLTDWTLENTGC